VASEGLFAELASSASVAGLLRLATEDRLEAGATVVCILTGHGLKEPDWAIASAGAPPLLAADADIVAAHLGLAGPRP
jgi:threonine synthase